MFPSPITRKSEDGAVLRELDNETNINKAVYAYGTSIRLFTARYHRTLFRKLVKKYVKSEALLVIEQKDVGNVQLSEKQSIKDVSMLEHLWSQSIISTV